MLNFKNKNKLSYLINNNSFIKIKYCTNNNNNNNNNDNNNNEIQQQKKQQLKKHEKKSIIRKIKDIFTDDKNSKIKNKDIDDWVSKWLD